MTSFRASGKSATDRVFSLLSILGAVIAVFGLAFDLVPGASPGFSIPQLLMIVSGLVLAGFGLALGKRQRRARAIASTRRNFRAGLALIGVTLLALEIVLSVGGLPTYFPRDVPEQFLSPAPWWTCDEAGCHYVYEEMVTACDRGEVTDFRCIVNKQGFHDTQDFVPASDKADRLRILSLGDSFAFGGSADVGKSYIETIERHIPQALVWNTGIPGAGTNQALMSFNVYAPILKPQVTILGFYMNDFDDNMMPVDSYFMGVNAAGKNLSIRQYQVDLQGNLLKLDQQSDLYHRYHRVDPPVNDIHRLVGTTRLGSLGLRVLDAARQMLSKADGIRLSRLVYVTREHLIALRGAAAQRDTQLLVLLIPRREDLSGMGTLYQNALRLMDELRIPYLDPIDVLDSETDYAAPPDVHWSNSGHQKIGEILTHCLQLFQTHGDFERCAV